MPSTHGETGLINWTIELYRSDGSNASFKTVSFHGTRVGAEGEAERLCQRIRIRDLSGEGAATAPAESSSDFWFLVKPAFERPLVERLFKSGMATFYATILGFGGMFALLALASLIVTGMQGPVRLWEGLRTPFWDHLFAVVVALFFALTWVKFFKDENTRRYKRSPFPKAPFT